MLCEKLEALPAHQAHTLIPDHREISKIVTWVSCFATYVAIVSQSHPECVKDMMAYLCLMVRKGYKHGGSSWLKYDSIFRRNNSGASVSWDVLDPSLLTNVSAA